MAFIVPRPAGERSLFAFSVTCNSISMAATAACLLLVTRRLQNEPQHPHSHLPFSIRIPIHSRSPVIRGPSKRMPHALRSASSLFPPSACSHTRVATGSQSHLSTSSDYSQWILSLRFVPNWVSHSEKPYSISFYTRFDGKYVTGRRNRFQPDKVYIFLIRIISRVDLAMSVCPDAR